MDILKLQRDSHKIAREHGFYEDRDNPTDDLIASHLMLMVSELAEALEELRDGNPYRRIYYNADKPNKPEGFPIELADVVIRVGDTAEFLGIDLTHAIEVKQAYNQSRPYKHGKTI